jgi:3-methyladenine DNA glycosylase AlkD
MTNPAAAADMLRALRTRAEPTRAVVLQGYFKTGPGEYGEGDRFIGVRLPALRVLVREFQEAPLPEIGKLLASPIHEARLLAVLLLVRQFQRATEQTARRRIYDFYLSRTRQINNWDLVDVSAPGLVGGWLFDRSRAPLTRLAQSSNLWERRIAVLATHYFIRQGDLDETFRIADILLDDEHDLVHKAVGWMLREAGQRDMRRLRAFLATRHHTMPRTMLRYAIEKMPERERRTYLTGARGPAARLRPGRPASARARRR